MNAKEKWEKIVDRGPILLPSFELSRDSGKIYSFKEDGTLNYDDVVGKMPNTYYDKSYRDWYYYSFSAWSPQKDEIGMFTYTEFDEDGGSYDLDNCTGVEVAEEDFDLILTFRTEKEFLEEEALKNVLGSHVKHRGVDKITIDIHCVNCDKDLKIGDEYLKVDEETRYCSDCYREDTVTYYTVDGEHVGDDNDSEVYDEREKEKLKNG